jgi:RNA polymerase sigma factor (sigma-70 family)
VIRIGCTKRAGHDGMATGVSGRQLRALGGMQGHREFVATAERDEQEVGVPFEDEPQSGLESLVRRAGDGDQSAWDALVERYLPLVTSLIRRHRLVGADADDVNQTVWLRLVEHLGDIREPEALPGWIATTTRNECLRVLRRNQRSIPVDPQGPSPLDRPVAVRDVEDVMVEELRLHALRQAVAELPATRRDLLRLLLTDPPLPYAEISLRLGIPVGSIGPTRARVLEQLRRNPALRALGTDDDVTAGER